MYTPLCGLLKGDCRILTERKQAENRRKLCIYSKAVIILNVIWHLGPIPRNAMPERYMPSSCLGYVHLPVCPLQADRGLLYRNDWTDRVCKLPTLFHKEIRVSPFVRVLPSRTLSQNSDLENFATAIRLCCQQNYSTVELVDHTYDSRT